MSPHALDPTHVHLWCIPLCASPANLRELSALLSSAERSRAERLASEMLRARYVIAHGVLRLILSAYSGVQARDVEIHCSSTGKPFIRGGQPAFNLSHCGDLALVGIGAAGEIGVDIERIDENVEIESIIRTMRPHIDASSRAADGEATAERRIAQGFREWTRLEAVVKAEGTGLFTARPPSEGRFNVHDVLIDEQHAAAVAATPAYTRFPLWRFAEVRAAMLHFTEYPLNTGAP